MELLRIVSMLMVVFVHIDGASLGLPESLSAASSARDVWRLAAQAVVIIGVNCFTLISGYFGIRFRLRSGVSYLFQCLFYAVGIASVAYLCFPNASDFGSWWESWLVFTHTDLWYVPAYFLLMLISPVINAGLKQIGRRGTFLVTGLFIVYTLWVGWWCSGSFNANGYTPLQLLMVYMIGRCLRLLPRPRRAWPWALAYLGCAAATFLSMTFLDPLRAYAYNSPFVLAESVALFMAFSAMRFRSCVVNYISRSAFAVYLTHKSQIVWVCLFKPLVVKCWGVMTLGEFSLFALLFALAVYIAVIPLDMLRRFVWRTLTRLHLREW